MISIAIKAAIEAGREILKIYNKPNEDFSIVYKNDNSPLTKADKASNKVIETILASTNLPVLSEEGKNIKYSTRKDWASFWLIDPLDGTKEFIKRNGEFTVNIALIKKSKPIIGIVYIPVIDTMYYGELNEGAWKILNASSIKNLENIECVKSKGIKLPEHIKKNCYTIVGSRSHMNDETENYIHELKKKYSEIDVISSGSSIKICLVAEGIADEYPRFGPTMEWDTAAGHAIANAAGKKLLLTDMSGELAYNKKNLLNPYFIVK